MKTEIVKNGAQFWKEKEFLLQMIDFCRPFCTQAPCTHGYSLACEHSSDTLTWQVMSKMIYLTSSESADPHHLGQIRGVGRQLHHHAPLSQVSTQNTLSGLLSASCLLELATSQWNIGFVTDPELRC